MSPDLGAQYEDILTDIAGNGHYQYFVVFVVLLPTFFSSSFISSLWLFIMAVPGTYWCKVPITIPNGTSTETVTSLLPAGKGEELYSKCELYAVNYSSLLQEHGSIEQLSQYLNETRSFNNMTKCSKWEFDRSVLEKSIVMDWELVCDRNFLPTLAYIITSLGMMVGTPIGGYLADRFGRKKAYLGFLAAQIAFGAATTGSPAAAFGFWIYVTLATFSSMSISPVYLIPSTLGMELVNPNFRTTFMVLLTVSYTFGGIVFVGVAYFFRSWRMLTLISTLPFFSYALYWFFMPESPRWLLCERRFDDVTVFLRRVAKFNHVQFDESVQAKFTRLCAEYQKTDRVSSEVQYTYLDLFRGPTIRRITFLMIVLSIVVQVCYNGLGYYAPSLGKDPYLSMLLSTLVELPGSLLTQLICNRIGRRLTIMLCFILGGTACLATLALPAEHAPFASVLTLFLFAKLFVTSAYTVQELMVNEMLPTVVRGKGVALTNFISSIASNIGPIIVYVGYDSTSLSLIIFGGIMIFASICAMFLPETVNSPLPESLEECEKFGENSSWRDVFLFVRKKSGRSSDLASSVNPPVLFVVNKG